MAKTAGKPGRKSTGKKGSTGKDPARKKPAKKAMAKAMDGESGRAAPLADDFTTHASARVMPPRSIGASSAVLDRLWGVVMSRRDADPAISHSARLLARGTAKIAQKFGEEAVECLIEATLGDPDALVAESADVLYHLIVMWVDGGIRPEDVWSELQRREGMSGIAEKASRARKLPATLGIRTRKIP
jgi:phosphoribosyl-ATP pyrophosphohydrolase